MDIGSGITAGVSIITGGAIIIKWISASGKSNGNGNSKTGVLTCSQHSGIVTMLEVLKQGQEEIRSDVKELLLRGRDMGIHDKESL